MKNCLKTEPFLMKSPEYAARREGETLLYPQKKRPQSSPSLPDTRDWRPVLPALVLPYQLCKPKARHYRAMQQFLQIIRDNEFYAAFQQLGHSQTI